MDETVTITQNKPIPSFIEDIKELVAQGRRQAYAAVNQAMVSTYWQIGKRIVEEEQQGQTRAEYGKQLLKELSAALTEEFGKGFSVQNLYYFRQFYVVFPEIFHTPCGILTWSHYRRLLSVVNEDARNWYLKEASEQMWSYATLNRNIATQYYERLLFSQNKEPVVDEMKYVNMFDENVRGADDNPTLGIVLCSETDADIARYLLNDKKNVFMSKYLLYLPTKEQLRNEIEQQKAIFALQQGHIDDNGTKQQPLS